MQAKIIFVVNVIVRIVALCAGWGALVGGAMGTINVLFLFPGTTILQALLLGVPFGMFFGIQVGVMVGVACVLITLLFHMFSWKITPRYQFSIQAACLLLTPIFLALTLYPIFIRIEGFLLFFAGISVVFAFPMSRRVIKVHDALLS